MSETKRLKESSDDSSNDEEEMLVEDGEEISIDFEGFSLLDQDFQGIKQLLIQLFSPETQINISELTNALIAQNFVGTILKQADTQSQDDDSVDVDDVYGLVTCYSLTRPSGDMKSSLINYLTSKCKSSNLPADKKKVFTQIIESSSSDDIASCSTRLGLIINERFVNIPAQASLPMFEKLLDEISKASNRNHKSRFDFTHHVMICKLVDDVETVYVNAEEELFAEQAVTSFDYKLSAGDDVMKTRRVLLLTQENMKKAVATIKEYL